MSLVLSGTKSESEPSGESKVLSERNKTMTSPRSCCSMNARVCCAHLLSPSLSSIFLYPFQGKSKGHVLKHTRYLFRSPRSKSEPCSGPGGGSSFFLRPLGWSRKFCEETTGPPMVSSKASRTCLPKLPATFV